MQLPSRALTDDPVDTCLRPDITKTAGRLVVAQRPLRSASIRNGRAQNEPSDDALKHRALATRLAPHDNDLRQLNGLLAHRVERILKLVDDGNERLHRGARRCCDRHGRCPYPNQDGTMI